MSNRPRTLSRVAAVQALYQAEQSEQNPETVIDQFVRHRIGGNGSLEDGELTEADVPLFAKIVRTATQQQDTLDGMLVAALPEAWPLPRLDGPPAKVVINEYLDVAHGFFHGDEPRMANGVLDRMAHLLRPAEFTKV